MEVVNRQPSPGSIKFITDPSAGSTFQISMTTATIGRDPTNDIVVSDPSVSRHHARILWQKGSWGIEKLAIENAVIVNGRDVQQAPIHDRDVIGLGSSTTFLFLAPVPASAPDAATPARRGSPALFSLLSPTLGESLVVANNLLSQATSHPGMMVTVALLTIISFITGSGGLLEVGIGDHREKLNSFVDNMLWFVVLATICFVGFGGLLWVLAAAGVIYGPWATYLSDSPPYTCDLDCITSVGSL